MCLVLLALRAHEELPLIVLTNRDELRARKTAPAAFWQTDEGVFAGRDLEKMGTWLGVTRGGRFAAVTNVRDPKARHEGLSRGKIVSDWLTGTASLDTYGNAIDGERYPAFNAIVGQGLDLRYLRDDRPGSAPIPDGLHGLSNARLDVFWPKVEDGLRKLDAIVRQPMTPSADPLFRILDDRRLADDAMLPATGVPIEWERRLSAAHIVGDGYGTRASTVVMVHRSGTVYVEERSFDVTGLRGTSRTTLTWPSPL
ncbi:NRDE family protein [soil metagenome]